ncbi:hypothetical protein N4T77_02610 [Clostridium sp. CX1]|nr:hypothetical protein [Clostridium sp. CX1]MCT8975482.1 hypothetical protein [Clostridium sp. CX1]
MINQEYVNWLVDRIKSGKINPQTGEAFKLEDIKIQEYRDEVEAQLTSQ